jgi:hypothetical protein
VIFEIDTLRVVPELQRFPVPSGLSGEISVLNGVFGNGWKWIAR